MAAASLPTLDQMTGARAGEYLSLGNDQQRVMLTFPEGEVDAVTITGSDLEGLQPMRFLSNNIIDFYVMYLERRLSSEDRKRYYFFNSFFFTKLLGDSSASTDIDQCEVDYDQVRKWTGEVNLFEKDYVFIPVLRSSHWSLIIICHLSSLTSSPDKRKSSPCIFHLDPVEGKHESFEGQVRSYLIQAWTERYRDSNKRDEMIVALACKMKYVRAKVPHQDNGYDCGLYLLHYVEVFIRESTSPDFSFASSNGGPHFSSPYFAGEVSAKRLLIQNLLLDPSQISREQGVRSMDVQPKPEPRASDAHCPRPEPKRLPKPPKGQNKTSKKWNKEETSVLLNRLVEGGRIRKGSEGATHWDLISQAIKRQLGSIRSEDQCRLRYDTLLKAYKTTKDYIEETGKPFSDIRDEERLELKLATPLIEAWYKDLDKIFLQRGRDSSKSRKRAKLKRSDRNGMISSSPRNPLAAPSPSGRCGAEKSSRKQVAIPGFSTLDEDLRSTLLNLIQDLSMKDWSDRSFDLFRDPTILDLEEVCQRLAVVQDQRSAEIRRFVLKLWKLKLVNIEVEMKRGVIDEEVQCLRLSDLWVYKKFSEKVLCKNPDFKTYLQICDNYDSISFPKAPFSSSLQRIRVLSLYKCQKLEHADLSCFPELRSLAIVMCSALNAVTGWEFVKKLGWLEIRTCFCYCDFPRVECLPSLREFCFERFEAWPANRIPVPDFSQCVRLRKLKIWGKDFVELNSMDISTLMFLEVLTFGYCSALSTIQGLTGLHFLTKVELQWCKALRRLPELGCLKALTHLNMSESGVEEISGVQELLLLTTLVLSKCSSLKTLPFLGRLKALAFLDISGSGVDEIPGVQDLVSLETVRCCLSRLKCLPDLHHLPRLRWVWVFETPLSRTDPSSFYYGKVCLCYNREEERMGFIDISDTEYLHSDDDDS